MDVAVFGDIGGHADLYYQALTRLGLNVDNGCIPSDLTVIQVGDLIDRGPDSDGVVEIVSKLIDHPRYVQLFGNHEGKEVGGERFMEMGKPQTNPPSTETIHKIQSWWSGMSAEVAACVTNADGEILVTHAGLTRWQWERFGSKDALGVTKVLNSLSASSAFQAGTMLGGLPQHAGVAWASTWPELIGSWSGYDMPFRQVHGHDCFYNWNKNICQLPSEYQDYIRIDPAKRHATYSFEDQWITGIDPCLGQHSRFIPVPFMIEDAEVTT